MKRALSLILSLLMITSMLSAFSITAYADDKDDWGKMIQVDGFTYYVSADGCLSAEVVPGKVIWVHYSDSNKSAWFGLDNTNGVFESGSRFWLRCLDPEKQKDEYNSYSAKLDESHNRKIKQEKFFIFLTGVTKTNGIEYDDMVISVPLYIQLNDFSNDTKAVAVLVKNGEDEPVDMQIGATETFDNMYDNVGFPVTQSRYARLLISKFSSYAFYWYSDNQDEIPGAGTVPSATVKTAKKANPLSVKGKTVKVKKNKKTVIKKSRAFKTKNAKGKLTFKKSKGNKKITVAKSGKITVKKGLKKGTYKVKIKVKAAGNSEYKAATKTVTVKIKVQ